MNTPDASRRATQAPNRKPNYDLFSGELDPKEADPEAGRYSPAHADRRAEVLEYLKSHGRVTRGELANICGITPEEASAVLRTLVDEGRLEVFHTPGRIMVSLASIEQLPRTEASVVMGGPDHD